MADGENSVVIEASRNSLVLEPSENGMTLEAIKIQTSFYFLSPTLVILEHKEVAQ